MSHAHIGGERGRAFVDRIGSTAPEQVLLVGVDVSKASWYAMGADLLGNVVIPGAKLLAFADGLQQLIDVIDRGRARIDATIVVIGIEATGHLHQTLAAHLAELDGVDIRLMNPAAVAAVRNAQLNRRRKTDELDAAAICELLRRGEGSPLHYDASAASSLRVLWNGRKDLVDTRSDLQHRVHALVDCLWPGMMAKDTRAGVRPLFCRLFEIKAARVVMDLLAEGWTPQRFAMTGIHQLRTEFAARKCRLVRSTAARIIARAENAVMPHPAATAGKQLLLASLLTAMDTLTAEIVRVEAEMADLLTDTQGAVLTEVRGIGVVAASGIVAFVGHTDRWQRWSQVWRAAGLDPARSQSGPRDNAYGISREGAAWGRRAILDLTASVLRQPGPRRDRYLAARDAGRPSGIAITAEANKLGRMCFALMATGARYDPAYAHRWPRPQEHAA